MYNENQRELRLKYDEWLSQYFSTIEETNLRDLYISAGKAGINTYDGIFREALLDYHFQGKINLYNSSITVDKTWKESFLKEEEIEKQVMQRFANFRAELEPYFSDEYAAPGFERHVPSAGHCVVMSVIWHFYQNRTTGFRSAFIEVEDPKTGAMKSVSHWWVYDSVNEFGWMEIDFTADQFNNNPKVMAAYDGELYPNSRVRTLDEVNNETLQRALKMCKNWNHITAEEIRKELMKRKLKAVRENKNNEWFLLVNKKPVDQ